MPSCRCCSALDAVSLSTRRSSRARRPHRREHAFGTSCSRASPLRRPSERDEPKGGTASPRASGGVPLTLRSEQMARSRRSRGGTSAPRASPRCARGPSSTPPQDSQGCAARARHAADFVDHSQGLVSKLHDSLTGRDKSRTQRIGPTKGLRLSEQQRARRSHRRQKPTWVVWAPATSGGRRPLRSPVPLELADHSGQHV